MGQRSKMFCAILLKAITLLAFSYFVAGLIESIRGNPLFEELNGCSVLWLATGAIVYCRGSSLIVKEMIK